MWHFASWTELVTPHSLSVLPSFLLKLPSNLLSRYFKISLFALTSSPLTERRENTCICYRNQVAGCSLLNWEVPLPAPFGFCPTAASWKWNSEQPWRVFTAAIAWTGFFSEAGPEILHTHSQQAPKEGKEGGSSSNSFDLGWGSTNPQELQRKGLTRHTLLKTSPVLGPVLGNSLSRKGLKCLMGSAFAQNNRYICPSCPAQLSKKHKL